MRFANRQDAGRRLAKALEIYKGRDLVIYALPRGGVILGFEIAKELGAPLDIVFSKKIGHPLNPEYAVCAITEEGDMFCNESEKSLLDPEWLKKEAEKQRREIIRRRTVYLGSRKRIKATGKIAIIVDDGIATGLTIKAAIKFLSKENPKKIIVASPVAPHDIVEELKKEANGIVVLEDAKNYLGAVGAYYDDFPQVTDKEIIELLLCDSY